MSPVLTPTMPDSSGFRRHARPGRDRANRNRMPDRTASCCTSRITSASSLKRNTRCKRAERLFVRDQRVRLDVGEHRGTQRSYHRARGVFRRVMILAPPLTRVRNVLFDLVDGGLLISGPCTTPCSVPSPIFIAAALFDSFFHELIVDLVPAHRCGWRKRKSGPCCDISRSWRPRPRHRYRIVEHDDGALPPSSRPSFVTPTEACWYRILPTSVEPVKPTKRTAGCSQSTLPIADELPVRMLNHALGHAGLSPAPPAPAR